MKSVFRTRRSLRGIGVALVFGLLATVLSACSGSTRTPESQTKKEPVPAQVSKFDQLVEAAKREGTVVLYGGNAEPSLQAIQRAFEKKYGIKVQYQRLASGPQREKIEQEVKANTVLFDVSQLSDEAWVQTMSETGTWAALDPDQLPQLKKVPVEFQRKTYAITTLIPLAMIYNTKLVSPGDLPKTSDDLLNPKWKGKFAMVAPETGLSIRTGYHAWLKQYGKEGFQRFMNDLFALQPRVVTSGANGVQQVAAGELSFVLFASAAFAAEPRGQGAPIAIAYPTPTAATIRTLQVAEKAKNKNAAFLMIDFLMSEEGQELLNGDQQGASPYAKGGTQLEIPKSVVVPDPQEVEKESKFILEVVTKASGK